MRFFERTHIYKEDWDTVTTAWWRKYPNPAASHVKEIDTYHREMSEGKFHTKRLFYLEYGLPAWIQKVFRIKMEGWATEEVECSRQDNVLIARGRNITFSSFFQMEEKIKYEQHPDNADWTIFSQRIDFHVLGWGLLGSKLETAARDNAELKANSGLAVMESVIQRIKENEYAKKVPEKVDKSKCEIMNRISFHPVEDR